MQAHGRSAEIALEGIDSEGFTVESRNLKKASCSTVDIRRRQRLLISEPLANSVSDRSVWAGPSPTALPHA
jgi:hypothetical protein